MPELPEVEAVCRSLARRVAGKIIRSVEVFRPHAGAPLTARQFCQRLRGVRIEGLRRRGKYLVCRLTPNRKRGGQSVLLLHLRMTGDLYWDGGKEKAHGEKAFAVATATTSLAVSLTDGNRLILDDPRGLAVCHLLKAADAEGKLARLGIEPLSVRFTPNRLFSLTRDSRSAIKIVLMDQSRIAGLGNIYSAEALFRAGIHPKTPAAGLTPGRVRRLHAAIVRVLRDAVQSAVRGYRHPSGFDPEETFEPQVYGREGLPCQECGAAIRRMVLGSRSAYYCPQCQVGRG